MAVRGKYKITKVLTKDMESSGGQLLLATISSIDPENVSAYVENVRIGCIQNDGDGDNGGFLLYASAASSWADSDVIAFGATGSLGGTTNLKLKRWIKRSTQQSEGVDGAIYIWAEVTDLGTTQNTARFAMDIWGRGHTVST